MKNKIPTKESLLALEKHVTNRLYRLAEEEKFLHEPITDGIVDVDEYLASTPKILWILKEPWEELGVDEVGGGWSVTHELVKGLTSNTGSYPLMAYVTYSVYNEFPLYDDIPYVTDSPAVAQALKHVAYINISKFPGGKVSHSEAIALAYDKAKEILLEQINTMAPDVIIAGGTLQYLANDFSLGTFVDYGSLSYCYQENRLYINAYHPNQRTISRATYCNDIIGIIKRHFEVKGASS